MKPHSTPPGEHRSTRFVVASVAVAALVASLVVPRLRAPSEQAPLPVLGQVPPFKHIDEHGRAFRAESLRGRVWVASFLYTSCPGPCPLLVARLRRFARPFADASDFRMVSFSVDPQTDKPEVLLTYARRHSIDTGRWSFVTGDPERVIATIRRGFYLDASSSAALASRLTGQESAEHIDALHGPIVHSLRVVLVDRAGRIRGYYDSNEEADLVQLARAVSRLLSEPADSG